MATSVSWRLVNRVIFREVAMGRKKTGRVSNVRIDSSLAQKAKVIAAGKGVSMAEYLSELIREGINKEWPKVVKSVDEEVQK
jgi:hypothetical protein